MTDKEAKYIRELEKTIAGCDKFSKEYISESKGALKKKDKEVGELRTIIIELTEQVKGFQAYIEAMEKEANEKSNIILPGGN